MDEKLTISIVDIDLIEVNYKVLDSDDEDETYDVEIDYSVEENDVIKFSIDLSAKEDMFQIDAKYLLVVRVLNVDDIKDFVENNKAQIIYPVYPKMAQLVSNLTDQSYPFPQIISPFNWFDDEEE